MRRSPLKLYAPFLALVMVQALFIAVAPSRAPDRVEVAAPDLDAPTAPDPASSPQATETSPATDPTAEPGLPEGVPQAPGAAPPGSDPADPPPPGDRPAAPADDPTPGQEPPGEPEPLATRDTSHCTPDGRQTDVVYYAPPCEPAWPEGADNGGATYRGVTPDTVRVVVFREAKNEIVTQLLRAEGLRATRAEEVAFMEAAETFLNEHFELYGRELDLIMFDATACPEAPPDTPACRQEARRAIAEHDPFAVIWMVPLYPEVFDEFVREGVISLGGWHFDNSYFAGRRPYRWDPFMDGTRTADLLGEYYCKKLANGNATHGGRTIHPSYPNGGARGQVPRRLGIVHPDTEAQTLPAERIKAIVDQCDQNSVVVVGYDPNPFDGARQAQANTESLIIEQVTTVVCLCDPIAPVFRTNNMTRNGFFPENLLAGSGLLDFDKLARLYDPQQWRHAFGPSHLNEPFAHAEIEASQVWRAAGNSGEACASCNLPWTYYQVLGNMLQMAGPELTPATVERGMIALPDRGGWAESGGDPRRPLFRFGQGNYTGINDAREVYWDPGTPSKMDGRPGAYVSLDGGRRYAPGQFSSAFDMPVGS